MEFRLVVSAPPGSHRFVIVVEPETELTHYPDAVVIWRPVDTQVWARSADGQPEQIAGFAENRAPGLDTGGKPLDQPLRQLLGRIIYDDPGPDSAAPPLSH